jgi:hypothetical protein
MAQYKIIATSQGDVYGSETKTLDLYGNEDIEVVYNLSDIREPESRKTNFTKTINIPATKINNAFFDGIIEAGWSPFGFNPNLKIIAELYRDNEIIISGYLQLTDIIKKADYEGGGISEYQLIIYGDIFTFFSDLGDTNVNELDVSEYNHKWTQENVSNSWDKQLALANGEARGFLLGEGYVYPMEWRGQTTSDFSVEDFYPAFYVKTIWDKIFNYSGAKYRSDFINSERFRRLILPFNRDRLYIPEENKKNREFEVEQDENDTAFPVCQPNTLGLQLKMDMYSTIMGTYHDAAMYFFNEISDPDDLWTQNTTFVPNFTGEQTITIDSTINTMFRVTGNCPVTPFFITGPNCTFKVKIYNYSTTTVIAEKEGEVIHPTALNPTGYKVVPTDFTWNYTGTFVEGQKYGYLFDFTVPEGPNNSKFVNSIGQTINGRMDSYLATGSKVFNSLGDYLFEGDTIPMNQSLPEMTAKEFITSLNKMFNLYWVPEEDGTIRIEPRDDFYTNDDVQLLDWTEKVDRNSDIKITPLSQLTKKEYVLSYTEDDDYYNEIYKNNFSDVYGAKRIIVNNDFVEGEYKIETKFSTSPLVNLNNDAQRIVPAYVVYENGYYERFQQRIRIHTYGGLLDSDSWTLNSNIEDGVSYSKYPYAGHLDNPLEPSYDILFNNPNIYYYDWQYRTNDNLFNTYWSNTIGDITSPENHMFSCSVYLNQLDISELNLFDTIQVDNVNYVINQLQYNPTTSIGRLELIKITTDNVRATNTKISGGGSGGASIVNVASEANWGNITSDWTFQDSNDKNQWSSGISSWDGKGKGYGGFDKTHWLASGEAIKRKDEWAQYDKEKHNAVNSDNSDNGTNNTISVASSAVNVWGNNNNVSDGCSNVSIQGNNNFVAAGLTNVTILGNNAIAKRSNTSYINGVEVSVNEGIVEGGEDGWLYIGGVNEVQNPFGNQSLITNLQSGRDTIIEKGGYNQINYLNNGINYNNNPLPDFTNPPIQSIYE